MRQLLKSFCCLVFAALFAASAVMPSLPGRIFAQDSPETWGDFINEPEISYGDLRSAQEHLEDERVIMSIFSGFECLEEPFPITSSDEFAPCWYMTGEHRTTEGGQGYVPAGENKAGFMKDFQTLLFPTRHSDVLIEQSSGYDRAWLRKGDALKATLAEDPEGNMPNFWIWDNPASLELQNEDGSPFYFHGNYIYAQSTFSKNGRWMLLFDTSGYLIRIDLETLGISTYRVADPSQNLWAAIAISDSGRYIAVNDRVDDFFVLDTKECTETLDYIKVPSDEITCTTRSIKDYAAEYFESLYQAWAEFWNDDVLRVRGISKDGQTGEEIIFRAPNTRLGTNYIALGDSYASGEGAYQYLPGTDDPNNRCHVSGRSYPFLLDRWLGLDSTHSVACSGARMNNIAMGHISEASQNTKMPKDQSLGKWLPGYKWQIEHIKDPSNPVDIVTVGISGNDIGFANKIKRCAYPGNCFDSTYERVQIAMEINFQFERVANLLSLLRREVLKKSPTAQVYLIGYPQIFSSSGSYKGSCGANVRLTYNEVSMATSLITYLNNTLRQAAAKAGVNFASVEGALVGHRLCDGSAIAGVNGLTAGNGAPSWSVGPFAIESYHPTLYGQFLLADAIQKQTSNFTKPMPRPNRSITAPDPLRNTFVGNATDIPSDVRRLVFGSNITPDHVVKGSDYYLFLGGDYNLAVGTRAVVVFHSEPTTVGEFEVDHSGTLGVNYSVPNTLKPGMHTLHVYVETISGEPIDIYKSVYVASSEDDWDGDGVPNNQEPCGIIEPAYEDVDRDGIDDGCDGVISSQPHLTFGYTNSDTSSGLDSLSQENDVTNPKAIDFLSDLRTLSNTVSIDKNEVGWSPTLLTVMILFIVLCSLLMLVWSLVVRAMNS